MNFEIVEQTELSGTKTRVYSILIHGENDTLYEKFYLENIIKYPTEIANIDTRLSVIGKETGLRDSHYKAYEGSPGDGICAFFDSPKKILRLYFIGFGKVAIILGGGGVKDKRIRTLQEDQKLTEENYLMRKISSILTKAIKEKRLSITEDGLESEDDFIFSDEN